MILAEKIIMLRKKLGWSQEELAEELNISRQSVSKWESGRAIPYLDKILKMSERFGVSTDFLLKDEIEALTEKDEMSIKEYSDVRAVSMEEASDFIGISRLCAKQIAAGMAACILSPVAVIFLGSLTDNAGTINEGAAAGIGVAILLLMIAAAVYIFIKCGFSLNKYEYLEKEEIALSYGVESVVKKKKEEFEPTFRKSIATGVTLCIIGIIPLIMTAALEMNDMVIVFCVDILLTFIAGGVFLFVKAGIEHESYQKLLQLEEYSAENKRISRKTEHFPGAYWCTVTAVYLAISFIWDAWDKTWVIWPVAGVLFAAVYALVRAKAKQSDN